MMAGAGEDAEGKTQGVARALPSCMVATRTEDVEQQGD